MKHILLATICFIFNFQLIEAQKLSGNLFFTSSLNGTNEVPAVTTNGLGVASVFMNGTMDTLCLTLSFTGLTGPATGAHIHEGFSGTNGSPLISLTQNISGNMIRATIAGPAISVGFIEKLISGKLYLNVHTAMYPGGEIRGQIITESEAGFTAKLNGSQEVPAVTTSAEGVGIFSLSRDKSTIDYMVVVNGLSGTISGAHLHTGQAGVNGSVTIDLTPDINGNVISGTLNASPVLSNLFSNGIYVNVHTAMNPGGEIRGQLIANTRYLVFESMLSGTQEVPPVVTTASGVARVILSPGLDTLIFDIMADGLSGPISGAHFHSGDPGVAGPIEISLNTSISGNKISGMVTGSTLTNNILSLLLEGGLYLNIHTTANPGGEIRGQVWPLLREGYTYLLEGTQEVPPVITTAKGSGFASLNREQNELYYEFVYNDLSDSFTSSHFHKALAGTSGGVIFDISSTITTMGNDGVSMGNWNALSTPAFTPTNAAQLNGDSLYINVHTTMWSGGEIRGQLLKGDDCSGNMISGLPVTSKKITFSIYPNPAGDVLNIVTSGNGTIYIMNAIGKQVLTKKVTETDLMQVQTAHLPAGIYFIEYRNTDGTRDIARMIKN